jgi:hypothetical protein
MKRETAVSRLKLAAKTWHDPELAADIKTVLSALQALTKAVGWHAQYVLTTPAPALDRALAKARKAGAR